MINGNRKGKKLNSAMVKGLKEAWGWFRGRLGIIYVEDGIGLGRRLKADRMTN
jgi:hypothetical protein